MARVGAPWETMGSSPERGKRGNGKRQRGAQLGGAPWGGGGGAMGAVGELGAGYPSCSAAACCT
jgi:hypothetical protein